MKGTARKGAHCACSHSFPKFQQGEHQKGKEQVRTHRPVSGDEKEKDTMAVWDR